MNDKSGILIPVVAAVLLILGIHQRPLSPDTAPHVRAAFTIAVVGAGLNGNGFSGTCKPHPDDACAMARGVHAALQSPEMSEFASRLAYKEEDDHDNPDTAQQIATRLAADPSVLAVIGHSSSNTTRAAAWIYQKVQIPLLVPIASTPYLKDPIRKSPVQDLSAEYSPDPDDRLNNVFSIIPDDKIGQAPALAYLIKHMKLSDRTKIVIYSSDNPDYVKGLRNELTRLLPEVPQRDWNGPCEDREPDTGLQQDSLPKVVILIATAKCANKFLPHLTSVSPNTHTVILTDGAKDVDPLALQECNCDVLLTFPTKPLNLGEAVAQIKTESSATLRLLNSAVVRDKPQSYEEYGFDSVLLLAKALHNVCGPDNGTGACRTAIGRDAVLNAMQRITYMSGARIKYLFLMGDNVYPEYNIYGYTSRASNTPVRNCSELEEEKWSPAALTSAPVAPQANDQQQSPHLPALQYMCSVEFEDIHSND